MKPVYNIMFIVSVLLMVTGAILFARFGLKLGVDFRGGSETQVQFSAGVPDALAVRTTLGALPFLKDVSVNPAGTSSLVIRAAELTEDQHQQVLKLLTATYKDQKPQETQFDSIGPAIGDELKSRSEWAIALVLIAVSVYIALVFRAMRRVLSPWAMSVATLIAMAHDILLPIGLFAALGHWMGIEIDAVFVAAILTIMGYSISDTVVVFDRVRENILRGVKGTFPEIVHLSIMQTLARSIATNVSVLLSLVAIFFFGGATIKYFSLALIVGIFSGAYSSIFVASPILVWMSRRRGR